MRNAVRRLVVRMWPGLKEEHLLWRTTAERVARITEANAVLDERLASLQEQVTLSLEHDDRIDHLRRLVADVEHYQPLYGVTGIVDHPQRDSLNRARRLESAMSPLNGQRVLDVGSSLGYMSFYLADRGALVTGWDLNAANVLVARAVGELNGLPVNFLSRELTVDSVRSIAPGAFDSALVLAVLHHVIHYQGLNEAQELVAELMRRVPVLYLELAGKGEDPGLFWDATQPDDPIEVLAKVRDEVEIEHLGTFPTHLSTTRRPLYRVSRTRVVSVAGRPYPFERVTYEAYPSAPVAQSPGRRVYYHAGDYVIKEYLFTPDAPYNWKQIIGELFAHSWIEAGQEVHHALRLLDTELTHERARLVLARVDGELLDTLDPLPDERMVVVARDVLKTVGDLHRIGLNHNDIRSWNIIVNSDGAWLIDYGLMSHIAIEDDLVALAWALKAGITNGRESYDISKTQLPAMADFAGTSLEALLQALRNGERDADTLLATLPGDSEIAEG